MASHRMTSRGLRVLAFGDRCAFSSYTSYSPPNGSYARTARRYATGTTSKESETKPQKSSEKDDESTKAGSSFSGKNSVRDESMPDDWENDPDFGITDFNQLPHRYFGTNQHIRINEDFKEALRQVLWQFRAPIRYAFAYGSGVFAQTNKPADPEALSPHPHPPEAVKKWQSGGGKTIDFIFGVSYTQHWHSINIAQHPEHYSFIRHLGSFTVSKVQDSWGAGVYFNPYITVNGTMIKYGVVNLDTICRDLSTWDTLYLAGRLQKPVKILRDDPRVRLANQVNLISAMRTALLMLPERFNERQLYEQITALSYIGDPRMTFGSENSNKVRNIVANQLPNFRQLYVPLIQNLPNVEFDDRLVPRDPGWEREDVMAKTSLSRNPSEIIGGSDGFALHQDMSTQRRANMVRRLPSLFRQKIYYQYRKKFGISAAEYEEICSEARDEDGTSFARREGGDFEGRIAAEGDIASVVERCVGNTIGWPSTSQSIKGLITAGPSRGWRYWSEKRKRYSESAKGEKDAKKKGESDGKDGKEEEKGGKTE